jgi:hypothetical protein
MKVLLVANNPSADVPSKGYDLYVHFNSAIHWGKTPIKRSIVAVRKNDEVKKNRSFRYTLDKERNPVTLTQPIENIVAVGWLTDVQMIDSRIPIIPVDTVPNYPKGNSPTSGFAAIYHYLSLGDDVTLCGFNLKEASYYKTTKLHLPDYEMEEIDKMIERGVLARH